MNLQELVRLSAKIETIISEGEQESYWDLNEALELLAENLPAKVDSIRYVLDRLQVLQAHWEDQAEVYQRVARGCAHAQKHLKEYVKRTMIESKVTELHGTDWRAKLSPARAALEVIDDKIPEAFKMIQYVSDRKKIREALTAGEQIAGARLVESNSLRFYPKKG